MPQHARFETALDLAAEHSGRQVTWIVGLRPYVDGGFHIVEQEPLLRDANVSVRLVAALREGAMARATRFKDDWRKGRFRADVEHRGQTFLVSGFVTSTEGEISIRLLTGAKAEPALVEAVAS